MFFFDSKAAFSAEAPSGISENLPQVRVAEKELAAEGSAKKAKPSLASGEFLSKGGTKELSTKTKNTLSDMVKASISPISRVSSIAEIAV